MTLISILKSNGQLPKHNEAVIFPYQICDMLLVRMGALPTDEFWKREFQEDKKLLIIAWGLVGLGVLGGALMLLTQLPVWVAILIMLLCSGGGAALFFTRLQKLEQSSSDRSVIEKDLQDRLPL